MLCCVEVECDDERRESWIWREGKRVYIEHRAILIDCLDKQESCLSSRLFYPDLVCLLGLPPLAYPYMLEPLPTRYLPTDEYRIAIM